MLTPENFLAFANQHPEVIAKAWLIALNAEESSPGRFHGQIYAKIADIARANSVP